MRATTTGTLTIILSEIGFPASYPDLEVPGEIIASSCRVTGWVTTP